MKIKTILTSLLFTLVLAAFVQATEIKVFAAASLTNALKDIAATYEKSSGDKIVFNFGASSELARQIKEGAPADLFISADEAQADVLEKAGLLLSATRTSVLSNKLVFVAYKDSSIALKGPEGLLDASIKRIATGEPNSVPIGVYTKKYLTKKGLWDKVSSKIIPTQNVRAALGVVESGDVEVGVVYKSDTFVSKKVKIIYEVPSADLPTPISYPFAVVKGTSDAVKAKKFLTYLASSEVSPVYKKYGFVVIK